MNNNVGTIFGQHSAFVLWDGDDASTEIVAPPGAKNTIQVTKVILSGQATTSPGPTSDVILESVDLTPTVTDIIPPIYPGSDDPVELDFDNLQCRVNEALHYRTENSAAGAVGSIYVEYVIKRG